MLEGCNSAKERWGGVHDLIDRWLNERQEMLVLFCAIEGLEQYQPKETPINVKLKAFCQILVDYVSAGHFEIYEQLFREAKEFNDGSIELAKEIYPKIEKNTQIALDFNDRYDGDDHQEEDLVELGQDLSKLGLALEERFEFEDQLIENLHESHRELVI